MILDSSKTGKYIVNSAFNNNNTQKTVNSFFIVYLYAYKQSLNIKNEKKKLHKSTDNQTTHRRVEQKQKN